MASCGDSDWPCVREKPDLAARLIMQAGRKFQGTEQRIVKISIWRYVEVQQPASVGGVELPIPALPGRLVVWAPLQRRLHFP